MILLVFSYVFGSGLLTLFRNVEWQGEILCTKICKRTTSVSLFLFLGDNFFFFMGEKVITIKNILNIYEDSLGQAIEVQKSDIFVSANYSRTMKDEISFIFECDYLIDHGR